MSRVARYLFGFTVFFTFLGLGCSEEEVPEPELDAAVDSLRQDALGRDTLRPDSQSSKSCLSWKCTDADCSKLVLMPGPTTAADVKAKEYGYWLASLQKYSYLRKDLTLILRWAVCEVERKFPNTTPVAIADLSQSDGKTPGTDVGKLRHPMGTHTGNDADFAYYQTDGYNQPQIICGDGSDMNPNGQPGKYNDGYFCTTTENIVDWPRQVWFFAKLFETGRGRVFGIDEKLVGALGTELQNRYKSGEISKSIFDIFNQRIGFGSTGGWQFHHHHTHLSFTSY